MFKVYSLFCFLPKSQSYPRFLSFETSLKKREVIISDIIILYFFPGLLPSHGPLFCSVLMAVERLTVAPDLSAPPPPPPMGTRGWGQLPTRNLHSPEPSFHFVFPSSARLGGWTSQTWTCLPSWPDRRELENFPWQLKTRFRYPSCQRCQHPPDYWQLHDLPARN